MKGGFFLGITNVISQLNAIVLNIILATLLFAEDFGLIALATTFIGFIAMVFSIGFGSAVIHYNDSTQKQISTLYILNYLVSTATFLIVFFSAPYAAEYYNNAEIEPLIKWCSINILVYPIFIIHYKILERDLEFKLISKIVIYCNVLSAILSITAAYCGMGVYALIVQALSATFFKLVFTLFYSKWRPNFHFNISEVKHMIWYAVKYRLSTGFLYFERNIDYLILGKFFNSSTLGYYSFSYNVMYTPVKRISSIFAEVLFPSLSSIKDDYKQIIDIYFKSMQLIGMVTFPIMALISFNADWVVLTVFGIKWIGAVPILKILCFAGAFQSISQFGTVVLDSIGKPELSLYVSVFRGIITVLAIILGFSYGIITVAYLILITKVLGWLVVLFIIRLNVKFSFITLYKHLNGVFLSVAALILSEWLVYYFNVLQGQDFIKLVAQTVLVGVLIWLFYSHIIKQFIKNVFKKIK
ncbi:lipopolysaccharide biosynthesis protein [Psychroserpens sp.]|uniref:lipopolysaccharide biosynthesis protein n=1 Tax=Psychroserpens sp. TaxID=2020870 RepID=UPI002B2708CE|nr:lipopolysaccharide biosynthesis protein [Psychroserpens sp.]